LFDQARWSVISGDTLRVMRSVAVAAAIMLTVPASAFADEPKEAIEHFDKGVTLYRGGSPEAAVVEFEASYKLSGNYRLLYNIALCRNDAKDYVGATDAYRRYLSEGGDQIERSRRDEVLEQIKRLALFIGRLTVRSNGPSGADVVVDDRVVGVLPLGGPLVLGVGAKKVSIVSGNATLVSKTVVVTSGSSAAVDLMVAERPAVPPAPADSAPPKPPQSFPWLPWAIAGAFGATATVTGVLAVGARNDAALAQARFGAREADIEPKQSEAEKFGLASDVFFGATLLTAGVATFLSIRYWSRSQPPVAVGPRGIVVGGTF
jgi:hypothetical protein